MMGEENPLNYDAWDGYQANRNRAFKTLYENNIGNNIMIAGDSHANWVSDLVWLDEHRYDDRTGAGSIGVEFAGTAVTSPSSFGQNITMAKSREISEALVKGNRELQWSEGYYRGYFELHVSRKDLTARYYGVPTNLERNPAEVSLANFTVRSGENRLHRPIAGGVVENGFLKYGKVRPTNLTVDTETGEWSVYEL
ncbi:hypothetical protein VTN31DRAFT_4340 [Thermomyces dupontii]|uniref:uncharacterized protein n=1 Tax=Talaromyces thermophilus TaxID=28565 RepID=UPI00374472A5